MKVAVVVLTVVDLPVLLGAHAAKMDLPKVDPIAVNLLGAHAAMTVLPRVDPIAVNLPGVPAVMIALPRVVNVVRLLGVPVVRVPLRALPNVVNGAHAAKMDLPKVVPTVVVRHLPVLPKVVLLLKAEVRLPGMPETPTRPLKVVKEEAHTRSVLLRTILKALKSVKAALLSDLLTLVQMPLKSVHLPSGAQKARPLVVIVQNPIPLSALARPKGLTF